MGSDGTTKSVQARVCRRPPKGAWALALLATLGALGLLASGDDARWLRTPPPLTAAPRRVAGDLAEPALLQRSSVLASRSTKAPADSEPDLAGLMRRLGDAMRPFQWAYWARMPGHSEGRPRECEWGFSKGYNSTFLSGCPNGGCRAARTLAEAQRLCLTLPDCGGVTSTGPTTFEVRYRGNLLASDRHEVSWLRKSCLHTTAEDVWHAFRGAVEGALADDTLRLGTDLGPPRDDGSIFVSISAYRDSSCRATVQRAYERADRPQLLHVGVVQQNCVANCLDAEGWGKSRRFVSGAPDQDCVADFCQSELGRPHCAAGRVRILRLTEAEAMGPLFSRFLNAKLWRGETYFLQIDSHTDFRSGWDADLIGMARRTPTYPMSVISNYPPSGDPRSTDAWPRDRLRGYASGLCACAFEGSAGHRQTVRLSNPGGQRRGSRKGPMRAGFVAAGFFFAHASFLALVPPDPYLPYLFMGEEILLTARLWTAGFDIYAPEADVLAHEYMRPNSRKFWETVNMVFGRDGMHNELTDVVLARWQRLLGIPEAPRAKQAPSDIFVRGGEYGLGAARGREDFMKVMGIDIVEKKQQLPEWCKRGDAPPRAGRGA